MMSREVKLAILSEIEKRKEIVFGAFSTSVTKQKRNQAWHEIHDIGLSYGCFIGKEFNYVRDTFWPNMRKATVAKLELAAKSELNGGRKVKFTSLDYKVLNILGKDSPLLVHFNLPETVFEKVAEDVEIEEELKVPYILRVEGEYEGGKEDDSAEADDSAASSTNSIQDNSSSKLTALKIKKEELEVRHLEMLNYKTSLELVKLERELGIPPSVYTKRFCNNVIVLESGIE